MAEREGRAREEVGGGELREGRRGGRRDQGSEGRWAYDDGSFRSGRLRPKTSDLSVISRSADVAERRTCRLEERTHLSQQ